MTVKASAIATTAIGLGVSLLEIAPASAAQFKADFFVDIVSGGFLVGETFSGQITDDDSFLSGTGLEQLRGLYRRLW